MGMVYLVGAGPGDAGLITVLALEVIKKADVIIYDYLVNQEILRCARIDAELIYVGKKASLHELPQSEINSLIAKKALEKEIIVRLKGGDPFIFGRGGEEALYLAERGITFEIVPGVTSAISVAAYAGIPLTHRGIASTVAFITGHEDEQKIDSSIKWPELATGVDTLVFLMGIKNLGKIQEKLIMSGRNPRESTSIIMWGTLSKQRTITGPLEEIADIAQREGITPPGIIVVGNVVGLRQHLQWFEKKPLFGKKIIVTRPREQSTKLGNLLGKKGAAVFYAPTIEIHPVVPNEAAVNAIQNIAKFDYILFTSVNGVSVFFKWLSELGKDARALSKQKIISIGPATASRLMSKGIVPDFVPSHFTSSGIVDLLASLPVKKKHFLLPRAEKGSNVVTEYITSEGGSCDIVPLYRALPPEETLPIPDDADIITFTSSSTAENFIALYGKTITKDVRIASIGPVTSETLKKNGFTVHIEAKRSDVSGLVEAIEHFVKA